MHFLEVVVLVAEQVMHASKAWDAYQVEFHISASSHLLPLLLFLSEVIIFVLGNNGQIRVNLQGNCTHKVVKVGAMSILSDMHALRK